MSLFTPRYNNGVGVVTHGDIPTHLQVERLKQVAASLGRFQVPRSELSFTYNSYRLEGLRYAFPEWQWLRAVFLGGSVTLRGFV